MFRFGSLSSALALLAMTFPAQGQTQAQTQDGERMRAMAEQRAEQARMPNEPGSGPYPAIMELDPTLPGSVVYRPGNIAGLGKKKLGVLLWGNGGCTDDGASARHHLLEIASHGYVAIAPGSILSGPTAPPGAKLGPTNFMKTTGDDVLRGLDWALAQNRDRSSPYHGKIDPALVAISGHSCGGILSIQKAPDPRIKAIIIHNSGVFPNHPQRPTLVTDKAWLKGLHTPILYVVGNATDVGQPVALDDYARIDHEPVFLASLLAVGHGGTFEKPNGGAAARVAVDWLEWQLRGDKRAEKTFSGPDCGLCKDPAWQVQRKNW